MTDWVRVYDPSLEMNVTVSAESAQDPAFQKAKPASDPALGPDGQPAPPAAPETGKNKEKK